MTEVFMRIAHLALLLLVTQTLPAGVAAQAPATTKVESQVVATGEAGMQFIVSPRGAHLAVITQKGSRSVVLFDGAPGQLFDQIMQAAGSATVSFSPDGGRYAYVGRSGAEEVVIVDGKEQLRLPFSNESRVSFIRGVNTTFAFSPDGKHVAYVIQTVGPGPNGAKFREYHVVYDGTVGPPDGGDGPEVAFSADGARHAYLITARAGTALNSGPQNKQLLVVDGKLAPYTAGALQFTADGSHLFSQRLVPLGPGKGPVTEVLVDGRPTMRVLAIRIFMAPVGNGFVGAVQQQAPGGAISEFLVAGATKIAGSECSGSGSWGDVAFSADGKHFAAMCRNPAGSYTMLVDGKKGPEYQMITDFAWAPDGSRAIYKAKQGAKTFVVTGDTESDGYQIVDTLKFGGGGKRTGFVATTNPASAPWAAVIEGKPVPRGDPQVLSQFGFSPDGLRWGAVAGYGTALTLVVDGVDQGALILQGFARDWHGAKFVFSPDSKHIVAFGQPKTTAGAPNSGLFIDGKMLKLGTSYVYHPTFTPDGRHLVFLAEDGAAQRQAVYVDGKAVAQVESNTSLVDSPGAWDLGLDGVLTFLAQDAGSVKRFRITLGSDTSIETLLALTKKP